MLLRQAFDAFVARQDYLWFLAAIGWATLVVIAWKLRASERTRPVKAWLLFTAWGGMIVAALELWLGATASRHDLAGFRPIVDAALVVNGSVGVGALAWTVLPAGTHHFKLLVPVAGAAVLLGAVVWRVWAPVTVRVWYHGNLFERGIAPFIAAAGLALVHCAIVLLALRRWRASGWMSSAPPDARRWLRVAIALTALQSVVCTYGPIAENIGAGRRWGATAVSPLGLPSAAVQLALVAALLLVCWRWLGEFAMRASTAWAQERRWLGRALAVWLFGGLALAEWAASGVRMRFESNLLANAKLAARLFDPTAIGECLGPRLVLGKQVILRQSSGRRVTAFEAKHVSSEIFDTPRAQLGMIATDLPGAYPHITTLRGDVLVTAIIPRQPGLDTGLVAAQSATPDDRLAWESKRAAVTRTIESVGQVTLSGRAPLLSPTGEMLGWFNLRLPASNWAASQAQARLLTFAVVALGLGLAFLLTVQRWHAFRHEESRRLALEAAAAERAKTDFLAKVSHELRTPAQSIVGYAQLMEGSSLTLSQRKWLSALRGQSDHLVRLVSDLLDLSALQMGTFRLSAEPTPFPRLVREAADAFAPAAARKNLALECRFEPGVPESVLGDGQRIRQVLLNLVGNAVKFTRAGRVEICARTLPDLPATPGMTWCEVEVRDTGVGIGAEDQLRLFQPFTRFRGSAEIEGSGLGLSLAHALMRSMGGTLAMESDGRTGSTFRACWLFQPVSSELASIASDAPSLEGKDVLVVEDNAPIRELLGTYLGSLGATVTTVPDATTALAKCSGASAVVLDLSLPDGDGFTLARKLRAHLGACPDLRIVALSAHAHSDALAEAKLAGIDAFFTKPADLRSVAAALVDVRPTEDPIERSLHDSLQGRFAQQFALELPDRLGELRDAVREHSWSAARRTAHYLRGSVAMLQLAEFETACARLERAATTGDAHGVSTSFAEIESRAENFLSSVRPINNSVPS